MSERAQSPVIGLTGGIGSGKSTVSAKLEKLGACVIDTDEMAREVVKPGSDGLRKVTARFGGIIVDHEGTLDRARLAEVVFGDPDALADLNGILHPLIEREVKDRVAECVTAGRTPVIVVIPLLFETNAVERYAFTKVIVVDTPEEIAVERVVSSRGMTEREVRQRMASQTSRSERVSRADYVLDNSSDPAFLESQVTRLWEELKSLG